MSTSRRTSSPDRRPVLLTRALWVLLALFMGVLASGCERSEPAATASSNTGDAHSARTRATGDPAMEHGALEHRSLEARAASDFSIYHAQSEWTDQTGAVRKLGSLEGRPRVVAMLYTSCAYACPRIMLDMKRIEGELGAELRDDVGFVVVSIDPERDTPERLAEFAAGSRLDPSRWTLLTGDEGDILELAALLGVQYRETSPGEWVHSNLITVLDARGEVVHRQLGLGTDPAETLTVLRRELAAR